MKRGIFFKCLAIIGVAPNVLANINKERTFSKIPCGGFKCSAFSRASLIDGEWVSQRLESRIIYSFRFDEKKGKGTYTAFLKNGNTITFPIYKYEPEVWKEKYGYLSELNYEA